MKHIELIQHFGKTKKDTSKNEKIEDNGNNLELLNALFNNSRLFYFLQCTFR